MFCKAGSRSLAGVALLSLSLGCSDEDPSPTGPADAAVDAAATPVGGTGGTGGIDGPAGGAAGSAGPRVITGALPMYHVPVNAADKKPRNDASGVAFLAGERQILVVDDGGDDALPDVLPFYLFDVDALFSGTKPTAIELPAMAVETSVAARHLDTEGATQAGGWVYVTSSLTTEKPMATFQSLSRFKVQGGKITEDRTISPREAILAALAKPTTDAWFAGWHTRWLPKPGREGGLNIEALSATPKANELYLGLRSPHAGATYLDPGTRAGDAIVVKVDVTTFEPATLDAAVVARLDLGGLGFRGMEYSPTAGGYFITAGVVEALFDYDFYFWNGQPGTKPVQLSKKVPEFAKLCRPESVTEIEQGGKKWLLVLSEESGAICEQPPAPYNYLLIELGPAFDALLR